MRLVKKPVSIAVAKAEALKMQRRQKEAAEKRATEARATVYKLCKTLGRMKSLETMQNYVDNFKDSRADNICNEILGAKMFSEAREVLEVYKKPATIVVEHCYDYSSGTRRHVFRIKEPGMIPRHEVVSSDYLTGLAELAKLIHPKKTGELLSGKYTMEECAPWAPYHEIPPAVAQGMLRKQQREKGPAWSMLSTTSQKETLH